MSVTSPRTRVALLAVALAVVLVPVGRVAATEGASEAAPGAALVPSGHPGPALPHRHHGGHRIHARKRSPAAESGVVPGQQRAAAVSNRRTLSQSIRRIARLARRAVSYEIWNLGVVRQSAEDIVARGIVEPVIWLPEVGPLRMLADPACAIEPDGGLSLYAEHLDYRHPQGEIWTASVPPGGHPWDGTFRPLLGGAYHLSYPMPFQDESGARWMTAESWQSGQVPVWRQTPDGLVPATPWLRGRPAVDPTVVRHDGRWYLFCTFQDEGPDDRLNVFWSAQLDGHWTPLPGNPVRTGLSGSRPAGPIFRVGDDLIRPAQDCSIAYGRSLVLHRIVRLTPDGFAEEEIRRIDPIPGRFARGIHTFTPAGEFTIVDGRRRQLDLLKPLRRVRAYVASR